jgi:hypothetical protein
LAPVLAVASPLAPAQSSISVDLLDAGDEGFAGIPAYRRCVDVFVDVDPEDVWTVGGLRVTAHHGATLEYYDGDPNITDSGGVINVGVENKFEISVSRPRIRDANSRFTNAGASAAGAFDPPGAPYTSRFDLFNIAWFASPPMTPGSPSFDGYIARISVHVRDVVPTDDYAGWFAGDLADAPPGALIVLRSEPVSAVAGTVFATFDEPFIRGIDWGLWYVPEPAFGSSLLVAMMVLSRRFRRHSSDSTERRIAKRRRLTE